MSGSTTVPIAGRAGRAISRVVRVVVGLAVLAAGLGVAGALVATRPIAPRVTRPDPLLQVRTMAATAADVPRVWEGYGTARAMSVAQIPAQVSGTISERPARIEPGGAIEPPKTGREPQLQPEGSVDPEEYVRAMRELVGDALIVQIDPSDYIARYRSALEQVEATKAQLAGLDVQERRLLELGELARQEREIQERELARMIEASALGGGNESEIERRRGLLLLAQRTETNLLEQIDQIEPRRAEARARLRDQRATAEVARLNLSRTVVTSPIPGTLQEVAFRPGDWAPAGSVVARVVDLSRVEVPLRMPMAAAPSVRVGDVATLRTDSQAGVEWSGRVVRLSPEADAQTRTFTVFVEVDQDPRAASDLLLPGQFVVGRITTEGTWRVLLVPRRAVDEDTVFVAADPGPEAALGSRIARRIRVQTLFHMVGERPDLDPVETQWSAVRADSELAEGAPIIVSNLDDLHEGLLIGVSGVSGAAAAAPGGAAGRGATP